MRTFLIVSSFLLIVILGLVACGTSQTSPDYVSNEASNTSNSKQIDDFEVSIHVENNLDVYATITYTGKEAEKVIYHGGSIYFFNIYQEDGDFEYQGAMEQPLLSTTLKQNEPHKVKFAEINQLNLQSGTYKFEAIADFSLDSNDVMGTKMNIPVSIIKEIE